MFSSTGAICVEDAKVLNNTQQIFVNNTNTELYEHRLKVELNNCVYYINCAPWLD